MDNESEKAKSNLSLNTTDKQKITSCEKECGIRKSDKRGYDVLSNQFFVEKSILVKDWTGETVERFFTTFFTDFTSFYLFLQGDIYENACYYKYNFSAEEIAKFKIDIEKINTKSLIDYDIDNFNLNSHNSDLKKYKDVEKLKLTLKKQLKKLYACKDYGEFQKFIDSLKINHSSKLFNFYLFNFIFNDKKRAFDILMQFVNNGYCGEFESNLCLIYNPQDVLAAYETKYNSKRTARRCKKILAQFVEDLQNGKIKFVIENYFDEETHFYISHRKGQIILRNEYYTLVNEIKYFETFEEFATFLDYDLSYCDLSKADMLDLDLSKFKIGKHTKLPLRYQKNLKYSVNKGYNRNTSDFYVEQILSNEQGQVIKTDNQSFKYFFDFVHFLKGDLSNADLLFCDGLENITDFSDLNLSNARLKSNILDRLGIKYEVYFNDNPADFPVIKNNELETIDALNNDRIPLSFEESCQKIYYISDLHLLHRLKNADSKSFFDVIYVIQKIIDNLLNDMDKWKQNIILIGGDTASNLSLFELFVKYLHTSIDKNNLNLRVIFTLGNHELWDFGGVPFDKIVEKYRKVITDNGMYLLQNNLIFKYDWNKIEEISTDELNNMSKIELTNRLKTARLIIFGGLGFAGHNEEFNAKQGIYRFALNREQELVESKKFELLYEKVCADLSDKRVIIFTHMPQKDWCSHNEQHSGFVYVNGHTHRNYFYDDGDYRIYADNQIGYYKKSWRLKYFYLEDDFDLFVDYKDGIYEITREEYIDFYNGKNISMTLDRDFYKLYMLKKNGYYMFILQSSNGNLNILNGGAIKGLKLKAIDYYFENMDSVISYIKSPLDNFSNYQKRISDEIKAIGGDGRIHGTIIDIDFFNHVYVNPFDLSTTAYWASDIIRKVTFPDTPALLKNNCPDLYLNYLKLLENSSSTEIVLSGSNSELTEAPQLYLDTDIYRASREIKKMQKLSSNILSIWIEPPTKRLSDTDE